MCLYSGTVEVDAAQGVGQVPVVPPGCSRELKSLVYLYSGTVEVDVRCPTPAGLASAATCQPLFVVFIGPSLRSGAE